MIEYKQVCGIIDLNNEGKTEAVGTSEKKEVIFIRQKQMSLTDNDRKIADSIYRNYLKNVAEQKKRQKQKLKKSPTV